ncbi:phage tail protein [Chitinimonas arctica]|uniref:Phage tail protein n=1 Tax=Chitinimonas arctica TaxID=2594795 RepID=A0A516SLV5_9NEIS|nr:phage tail protein [Chitinimonas arctica]QDQ29132.1 phage tail protein [Chitinimonas arctica]
MRKPQLLRDHLARFVPSLAADPDKLLVFVEGGRIRATGARSLSFEYQYRLRLVLLDFNGNADMVIVPILAWLKDNQPDHLLNYDKQADGFQFEAELLNHDSSDLAITLALTERVLASEQPGGLAVQPVGEPPLNPHGDVMHWELFIKGAKVGEWDAQP